MRFRPVFYHSPSPPPYLSDIDVIGTNVERAFMNHNGDFGGPFSLTIRPVTAMGAPSVLGCSISLDCVANCSDVFIRSTWVPNGGGSMVQQHYAAVFDVPHPLSTYEVTVVTSLGVWTKDTHDVLGGIVPGRLSDQERVITVYPLPTFTLRLGQLPLVDPSANTKLVVHPSSGRPAWSLRSVSATIDGVPADVEDQDNRGAVRRGLGFSVSDVFSLARAHTYTHIRTNTHTHTLTPACLYHCRRSL